MQATSTLSLPNQVGTIGSAGTVARRLKAVMSLAFGCRHKTMSLPFTREARTYRVCLHCGMRRDFDLRSWEMYGPFYVES
jgi:hypothetical protein